MAIELVSSQHILTEPDAPESENDVADATNQIHCLKCAAVETANDGVGVQLLKHAPFDT